MELGAAIAAAIQNLWLLIAPIVYLLVADALAGAIQAWRAGTFAWEWFYVFGRTKGLAFAIAVLVLAFGQIPMPADSPFPLELTFTGAGVAMLAALGASLTASIGNNLKAIISGNLRPEDLAAPQGVDGGVGVEPATPTDEPVLDEAAGA